MRKPASALVNHLPITKARINLGQLAKRAHLKGEYFILEKDGIPVIGIMDADELEDYLETRSPKVNARITRVRQEFESGKGRLADNLVSELQAIAAKPKSGNRGSR